MSEASEEHVVHTPSYLKPKKEALNSLFASGHVNENSAMKTLFREISHIEKVQSEVISKQRNVIKELEESESVKIGDLSRELKQSRQEVLSILQTQCQYLHHISKNMQSTYFSTSKVPDLPDPSYFYKDDNLCTLKGRGYKQKIFYIRNQLKTQMEIVSKLVERLGMKNNDVLFCNVNRSEKENSSKEDAQVHLYPVPSLKFVCDYRPQNMMKSQELDILQAPLVSFAPPPQLIKQMENNCTLSANVGTQKVKSFYELKGRRDLGQSSPNTKSISNDAPMSDITPSDLFQQVELQSEELCKSIQEQIEMMRNDLQALGVQMSQLKDSKTPHSSSSSHEAHTTGKNSPLFDGREVIEWNEFQSCLPKCTKVSNSKSNAQGKLKSLEQMANGACTYVQNNAFGIYPHDQRLEIEPLICSNSNHMLLDFRNSRSKTKAWIKKKLKRIRKRQRKPKVGKIYDAVKAFDERTF